MQPKVDSLETENLADYFGQFGELKTCRIIYKHESNVSRGFGFVVYKHKGAAERVIAKKDEHFIKGVWVDCKPAILRREMDHNQHTMKMRGQLYPDSQDGDEYQSPHYPSSPRHPDSPEHGRSPQNRSPARAPLPKVPEGPAMYANYSHRQEFPPQSYPRPIHYREDNFAHAYTARPRLPLRGDVPVIASQSPQRGVYPAERYSPSPGYYPYPPLQSPGPGQVQGQGMNKFRGSIAPIQTGHDYAPPGLYQPEKNKQVDVPVPVTQSLSPRKEPTSGFVLQAPNPPQDDLLGSNKNVQGYLRQPLGLSFTGNFFQGGVGPQRAEVASSKNSPRQVEYKKYYSPTQKHRSDNYSRLLHPKVINLKTEVSSPGTNPQPG